MGYFKKIFLSAKTVRLLAVAAILVIVSLSAYGITVWKINKNIGEAVALGGDIAAEAQKDRSIESIRNILRNTAAEREKIDGYFVKSDNIVDFLEKIELMGKKSGVALSFDSVDIPQNEKNVLRLRIGTEGNWEDSFYFLSLLENLPYKIELEKSALAKISKTVSNVKTFYWRGDFTIRLLSFTQNK